MSEDGPSGNAQSAGFWLKALEADSGITVPQLGVARALVTFKCINHRYVSASAHDVGFRCGIPGAQAQRLISALVNRGYLRRLHNGGDSQPIYALETPSAPKPEIAKPMSEREKNLRTIGAQR